MKNGKKMKKDEKVDGTLYFNNDIITMNKEGMAEIGCAFFDVPVGISAVYPPRNPILVLSVLTGILINIGKNIRKNNIKVVKKSKRKGDCIKC